MKTTNQAKKKEEEENDSSYRMIENHSFSTNEIQPIHLVALIQRIQTSNPTPSKSVYRQSNVFNTHTQKNYSRELKYPLDSSWQRSIQCELEFETATDKALSTEKKKTRRKRRKNIQNTNGEQKFYCIQTSECTQNPSGLSVNIENGWLNFSNFLFSSCLTVCCVLHKNNKSK